MFLNKKTSTIYFLNFSICFEVIVCQFIQCESLMFLHNSNILIDKNKNNDMFCINVDVEHFMKMLIICLWRCGQYKYSSRANKLAQSIVSFPTVMWFLSSVLLDKNTVINSHFIKNHQTFVTFNPEMSHCKQTYVSQP